MSPRNKINKMKHHLEKLENQTRSYEVLSEISSSLVVSKNLNDLYVDSIKAKIAYLNELVNN